MGYIIFEHKKYNKSLKMWTVTSIVSISDGLVSDFD